jgi:radical SAM-linked protein
MLEIRMLFEKKGRAVFLSHLDLLHVLQRSFSRAGIRCAYSEGFNPHMQLRLPVPLPLGHEGLRELLEVKILDGPEPQSLCAAINPFLPEGISIIQAFLPVMKASEMAFADYLVKADLSAFDMAELERYLGSGEVVVMKRTKRGESLANIGPDIHFVRPTSEGIELNLTASPSANLNPVFVVRAMEERFKKEIKGAYFIRRELLNKDFLPFR